MCFTYYFVTLTLTFGQIWWNFHSILRSLAIMEYWKIVMVYRTILTQWRVEFEAKSPMLHNGNIHCHGNTCLIQPIILKYFISNRCPHMRKWLNFGINRATIENFFLQNISKKILNFFDVTSPKNGASHVKSESTLPIGHRTRNILHHDTHRYDDLFKSYDP